MEKGVRSQESEASRAGLCARHRTITGIQKEVYYIDPSLDSGYPPAADSGMTDSANCDTVSKGRGDLFGVKCIGVLRIANLEKRLFP